jgi:hypothetical protein
MGERKERWKQWNRFMGELSRFISNLTITFTVFGIVEED